MGAYTFAGIVAPCRAQAGQMQACLHKPPAFAVGYLTTSSPVGRVSLDSAHLALWRAAQ